MNRVRLGIVTFGFLGCAPVAPGTFGTLGAVLLAWALGRSGLPFAVAALLAAALLYAIGRSLASWAERRAGGEDPGFFVLDEVVGYLLTVLWIEPPSPLALTVGFFLFRFFDILKPPPVRRLEAIGGGDGILLDDVMAGLYGFAVMAALRLAFGPELWTD